MYISQIYFFTNNLQFLHVVHVCACICVCLCVFVCAPMHGCTVICELWQFKCFFMRPSNDEGSQLYKFHFPCNKQERWIYILSLESATSIQKPRNLLKVAYHPVSCLLHHYINLWTTAMVEMTARNRLVDIRKDWWL